MSARLVRDDDEAVLVRHARIFASGAVTADLDFPFRGPISSTAEDAGSPPGRLVDIGGRRLHSTAPEAARPRRSSGRAPVRSPSTSRWSSRACRKRRGCVRMTAPAVAEAMPGQTSKRPYASFATCVRCSTPQAKKGRDAQMARQVYRSL